MLTTAVIAVTSTALALAAIIDLKTGEIPEKLSIGLIIIILGTSLLHTVTAGSITHITHAIIWGLVGLTVGYLLFAFGQWGGGDVKLLTGVGCLLGYLDSTGYPWPNNTFVGAPIPPLLTYFIDMAFAATPYVILYTLALGLMHPAAFREYARNLKSRRVFFTASASFLPSLVAAYFGFYTLSLIYLLVPLWVFASIYMKTVEEVVLMKTIPVSSLKEWDIMANDVVVDGRKIASRRNIEGITPEQLEKIKKLAASGKIGDTIKIKWGVKFAPILLASLLLTLYLGNILELIFNMLPLLH